MKKNILTLYLLFISLIFVFNFIHSKDMVEKYRRGSNQSVDCERLTTSYENGSNEFDFNNKYVFEQWEFCIAQGNKFFYYGRLFSLPIAACFIFLAFYQRKFELKMSNRTFFAALASPLAILFIISFIVNFLILLRGYLGGESKVDSHEQIYALIIGSLVLVSTTLILIVRFAFRTLSRFIRKHTRVKKQLRKKGA